MKPEMLVLEGFRGLPNRIRFRLADVTGLQALPYSRTLSQ